MGNKMLKVFLIILAVLVVVMLIAMIGFKSYLNINAKELASDEIVLQGTNGKKALVLYQKTKHDTATNITMALAEKLNSEGYTVVVNHPSSKLTYSTLDYDVFAFGSGVYMGSVSEPLKEYLETHTFDGKKVMVYAVGSALEEKAEIELLKGKVSNALQLDGIKVGKGQEDKIKEFVNTFLTHN